MRIREMALFVGFLTSVRPSAAFAQHARSAAPHRHMHGATVPAASTASTASTASIAPASSTASTASTAPLTRDTRMRDVEHQLDTTREQLAGARARLSLLAEALTEQLGAQGRVTLTFQNQVGGAFRLVRAAYLLDGAPLLLREGREAAAVTAREPTLYSGVLSAGEHRLTAELDYEGTGYGVFAYVRGYTFHIHCAQRFVVEDGGATRVQLVGHERGGPTTPLEQRLAMRLVQSPDPAVPLVLPIAQQTRGRALARAERPVEPRSTTP